MSTHTTEQLQTALAGRYAIERKIGEGGMATVYLAKDLKHDRRVALKVLKPELGAVLGVERFLSEIKVTANLQHPNLLPLFDSGEANGLLFYVMPFVEGESLRARLEREQQLSIEEAVRISIAIASALGYAHERGVIHRDLKPENILLQSGQPVVADFGIALAVSNAGGARVTQTGLSLGTPQYMSPEQATGDRAIDARSDLYSLAAMTYEMIAGEPPHSGPNAQAIMAKLLTADPAPLSSLRTSAPVHVELAIAKALAKVPADRFASAADFAAALDGSRAVTLPTGVTRGFTQATPGAPRPGRRELAAWGVALAAIATATWMASRPETVAATGRYTVTLPESVLAMGSPINTATSVAISPDGRMLAFVGQRRLRYKIYLRRADETVARELEGTEQGSRPVFSPDGRSILFMHETGVLFSLQVAGGAPKRLADSAGSATWLDDRTIVFTNRSTLQQLHAVSPNGGEARIVAALDAADSATIGNLAQAPGTSRVYLELRRSWAAITLGIADVTTGRITDTGLEGASFRYAAPGHVLYGNPAGVVAAVRVGRDGTPARGTEGTILQDAQTLTGNAQDFSVSHEGTILYRRVGGSQLPPTRITLVHAAGRTRVLRDDGRRYDQPIVSPDGARAILRVGASSFQTGDLWLLDLVSGAFTPLTRGGGSYRASWSRDGNRVFYLTGDPNVASVHSMPWDGSGADSVLFRRSNMAEFVEDPSGDGFVIRTYGFRDIQLVPKDSTSTQRPRSLVEGPSNETNPAISPNGRLLAYTSDQSGQREVYVTAFPGPGPRVPVSIDGGVAARWSADGTRLFYRSGSAIRAATIVERPALSVTRRDLVLAQGINDDQEVNFAVLPRGGFLLTQGPDNTQTGNQIGVVTNWQAQLKSVPGATARP